MADCIPAAVAKPERLVLKMNPSAQWMWFNPPPELKTNITAVFRREFHAGPHHEREPLILDITADTTYRLYLNGIWLGDGPARAYPQHFRFDRYHVEAFLRSGRNLLEVVVTHHGVSTFHHKNASPGLLVSLQAGDVPVLLSNNTWEVRYAPEFISHVPRISCQQGFEEQYNALLADTTPWLPVTVTRSQEEDDHQNLELRDVPLLTCEPRYFRRVIAAQSVLGLPHVRSLKVRETLTVYGRDSNIHGTAGLYYATFYCVEDTVLEMAWIGLLSHVHIDGRPVAGQAVDGVTRTVGLNLAAGEHLLCLAVCADYDHPPDLSIGWRAVPKLRWNGPAGENDPTWYTTGPLWVPPVSTNCLLDYEGKVVWNSAMATIQIGEETTRQMAALAQAETLQLAETACGFQLRELTSCEVSPDDALFSVRTDTILGHANELLCAQGAMLRDNCEPTTVMPDATGAGVRVILDLDDLTIGYFEFDVIAPEKCIIDGYFVEHLEVGREGALDIQHTSDTHNSFRYTCRDGHNYFRSRQRRGMRYALLTIRNFHEPVEVRLVRVIESTYPVEFTGSFQSSDPYLNRIYDISRRTLQLCMEDVFTDCPLYEQTLWIGDARNEALFGFEAFGSADIAMRCCRLGAQSLEELPLVGSQVPSGWDEVLPAWSFLWEIMVWETYFHSGDRAFLEEMYPALMTNVHNAVSFCNHAGLFSAQAWNLLDWAEIDHNHPTVLHNSLLLVGALAAAHQAAAELHQEEDAVFCTTWQSRLRDAINALWVADRGAYSDALLDDDRLSPVSSQHTSALALLYDVIPDQHRQQAIGNLLHPRPELVLPGSPFAMMFVLEALMKAGEFQAVLDTVREYWGVMLRHGAKTCWECVSPAFRERGEGRPTRSHCHGWSAAPIHVLVRQVLGVIPLAPGFAVVKVAPDAPGIDFAQGTVPTPKGALRVAWRRNSDGTVSLDIDAPHGIKVERGE
jgi:alpha-L-rhamnosidase